MTHPLADATTLPPFPAITPEAIGPAVTALLAEQEATVAHLIATAPASFAEAWLPMERGSVAIDALWSAVTQLQAVADTPALRAAHAAAQSQLVAAGMRIQQNRDLHDLHVKLAASPDFATLPLADRVAVEHAIRDATLSGVALPPEARARFAEISMEISALGNGFASAVLDATDAWSEQVTDEALLAGVSPRDKAMFAAAARTRGLDGWLVTLQQPSVGAILTFAENRALRERVYHAFNTRASDQGPHAGQFDNSERIARIVALRREGAALLGFADPVEWSLSSKMAPNAGEVLAFLRDLAARARPFAEREMAVLRDFAAMELEIDDLQPWDVGFASDRLRSQRHAIDEAEVRAYFPVDRVIAGWHGLVERLYGIRFVARDDVALPHSDGCYYDAVDAEGTVFAGLYVDLHARPGKRGGAWMAGARSRLNDGNVRQVPVAYLTCNFAPNGSDTPALLSHREVVTLLHETGHCLHLLCTEVDRPSIAGTSGVEWDAIELPSQLMEDFAWDRDMLTGMSGHYQTGEPLPNALFNRMLGARHFQAGMFLVRQIEFALFDLLLHLGTLGDDPIAVMEAVRAEVAVVHPPAWHRFPHAFLHIFASGYASGYYSYLWAEVLAADGFQHFVEGGRIDRSVAAKFRKEVLARGASRPAADSFRAFRGRDADPAAMLVRHGLTADAR
ncbi:MULTISPECIES: M3 family metallopeptidase [unclassified Sphingomonas]|uniref:M3 family metallopeptidase n=1 Tax=unclassified Sphingomonas TaxID=196159 RepID=UPI0006FA03FA|nr:MULTISPECIES: M3 family metallopeptidase [unclassified Sphingomonas]KQM27347.1 oligopeptidase A [Sphingomonas sp. Leaf9]KQM43684.1 oligopeptidase A [Sphingomonas sp. Leaf11]